MASPDDYRISDAMYDILWLSFKKKYGKKVKLGGIYADKTGYHDARAGQSGNYSVRHRLDKTGPSYQSAAIDWTYSDKALIKTHTKRLLKAYDDKNDPRVGPHNVAEFYGTTNGYSVVGRLHGRWATSDSSHLWHIHLGVHRKFIQSAYVMRAIISVVTGESLASWRKREHPTTPVKPPVVAPKPPVKPVDPSFPYTIKKGETLRRIAQRYNTTVEAIQKINPAIKDIALIRAGATIQIPGVHRYELGPWPKGPKDFFSPYLKGGAPSYETLKNVQRKLNSIGYKLGVDGRYEKGLYEAIKDFQGKNGLKKDGILGPLTYEKLRSK